VHFLSEYLRVASQVDSRVIIDQGGAEKLLGYGDLLFVNADGSDIKRIQSPNVTEEEIKDVVAYLRSEYDDLIAEELKVADGKVAGGNVSGGGSGVSDAEFSEEDDKYEQAKEVVIQTGKTSVSNLQVRLGTGYARSAKLINMLEQAGVIITTTDNSGKKVKVVAGHGNSEASPKEEESNTREDILKVPAKKQAEDDSDEEDEAPKKEDSGSFFRF
jgi:S-DNA-T family DNA segregation ATPase FtsK/SpoIIIE